MAERRDFLRKVAVAGTGAFALRMIVTVDAADAQALTSPPPQSPSTDTGTTHTGTTGIGPGT
jgi:hypothetical protein